MLGAAPAPPGADHRPIAADRNPLTPIRLSAERLKRKYLPQDPEGSRGVRRQRRSRSCTRVDNIGRLINEFSAFAPDAGADLRARVGGRPDPSGGPSAAGRAAGDRFETRLPAHDVQLYCDGRQVAQALTNLLQNAVDSVLERRSAAADGQEAGWVLVRLGEREAGGDRGRGQRARPAGADGAADRALRHHPGERHGSRPCDREEDHGRAWRHARPSPIGQAAAPRSGWCSRRCGRSTARRPNERRQGCARAPGAPRR